MPRFDRWTELDNLSRYSGKREEHMASMNWRKIQEKPTSIIIFRNGVALAAQDVRIEDSNFGNFSENPPPGSVGDQDMIVLGLKGHRTRADLNIQKGDRFIVNSKEFEVRVTIDTNTGWMQAHCDVLS